MCRALARVRGLCQGEYLQANNFDDDDEKLTQAALAKKGVGKMIDEARKQAPFENGGKLIDDEKK